MSTRSYICIELTEKAKQEFNTQNEIFGVYCHYDGYIKDGVGETLLKHYTSYAKAKRLMKHGDMSSLGDSIKECNFYNNPSLNTTFNFKDIRNSNFFMICYIYVYRIGKGWQVWGTTNRGWRSKGLLKDMPCFKH